MIRLPDKWYKFIFDALFVFGIAFQFPFKHLLLVADTERNNRHIQQQDQKRPRRTHHKRHTQKQQKSSGIHRVAHNTVKTCADHLLVLLRLYRPREPYVLAHHLGIQRIARYKKHGSRIYSPLRQHVPTEAVTQSGNHEHYNKNQSAQSHNRFCSFCSHSTTCIWSGISSLAHTLMAGKNYGSCCMFCEISYPTGESSTRAAEASPANAPNIDARSWTTKVM